MAKEDKTTDQVEEQVNIEQEIEKAPETEKESKSELEIAQEALQQEKDKFLRLFAEFENYKKRTSKERIELFKTAGQEVISAMLPVLDDFDRAIIELEKTADKETSTGINLINNKLNETLKSKGLELMDVNAGDAFDAEMHEAVTQIPAPTDELKGKIVDVIEKGYKLGERIIRFPKVVTGQ